MPESAPAGSGLRLRAEDCEDLAVISACLQDALVAVRDLAYDADGRTFMLVANRFRWEGCGEPTGEAHSFERTLCGLTFDTVEAVAYRGFHRSEEDRILSLLAVRRASEGHSAGPAGTDAVAGGATIDLEFAGDATIRITAAAIRCRARDFGEPWPTPWRPGHRLDETG